MSTKSANAGDWGPGVKTLVSPKSENNLPTGIDREVEQALPAGAATPGGAAPTDSGTNDDKRDIPKFEMNRPNNGLPDRPRSLPTPGEEYGHPVKLDYNMPTRRHEQASMRVALPRTPGESCKACGRDIVAGFEVSDEVWGQVVGDPDTIRCVMCFDEAAHEMGVEYEFLQLVAVPWADWEELATTRVVLAYKRRWKPGKRQRKQKGMSKQKRRQYYQRNKNKIKQRAKQRYKKNRHNPVMKRLRKHRQKNPQMHRRRHASPEHIADLFLMEAVGPSPVTVASMFLEGGGSYHAPKAVPPSGSTVQKRQRGGDKLKSKRDYTKNRSKKKRNMTVRHKKLQRYRKFQDYKKWYNKEYRRRGEKGFRRRGQVLTSPEIQFVIGAEMVPGFVHNISPMTGMVTFVTTAKDWEHLHSMPAVPFMESVVFLSEGDIDAFFELVDVEIGLEAYQEVDEDAVRECAYLFDVDPESEEFADQCHGLVGQSDIGLMTADQLGMVSDVLVTGYLEGGHTRKIDEEDREKETLSGEEGELYNWHLIYGIVPDPDLGKTAEGITFQMEREGPKDEIDHAAPGAPYTPTSPSHYRRDKREPSERPSAALPDKHLDHADPSTSRVLDHGLEDPYAKTATTIDEIATRTSGAVHGRARQVSLRLRRANPKTGMWLFQAQGSKGTYAIRVKGIRKGNMVNLHKAQVKVSCSCDFFRFQGPEHWAKSNGYLYGRPRGTATAPEVKDPGSQHWACKHVLAALNLARKYRFSSEMIHLANAEIVPDFEWADQWEGSVTSLADRFLASGG